MIRGRLLTAPGADFTLVSRFEVNVSVVPGGARGHCFHKGADDATSGLKQKEMNSSQWGDLALICLLLKHYTLQRDVLCLYITLALRRLHSNKIDWLSWGDTTQKGLSLWFVWELCRLFKRDCEIVTRFNPKAGREYLTAHCLLLCMSPVYLAPFQNLSHFHLLQISFLSGLKLFHFPIKFPLCTLNCQPVQLLTYLLTVKCIAPRNAD